MKSVYEVELPDGNGFGWPWTQTAKVIRVDDLRIPIHFCLGRYEAATQEEINDLICDLTHELERR